MTLQELRFVVTLAKERSFWRAAKICAVGQPALSLGIKKLEQELGVIIFERMKREAIATPIGEKIIAQACRTLEDSERLKAIAHESDQAPAVRCRLGIIYSVAQFLIPKIIPAMRCSACNTLLELEENLTENLQSQLRMGLIDAAIVALPFDMPDMQSTVLYKEAFSVLVPASHRWARRTSVVEAELSGEKILLLDSSHCFRNQVLQACPNLAHAAEIQQANSLDSLRNMVASNLGITVMPCSATLEDYQHPLIRVIPFAVPAPDRTIVLAWRKSCLREQAVMQIVQAIRLMQSDCVQIAH